MPKSFLCMIKTCKTSLIPLSVLLIEIELVLFNLKHFGKSFEVLYKHFLIESLYNVLSINVTLFC